MFFVRTAGPQDLKKIRDFLLTCFDDTYASLFCDAVAQQLKDTLLSEAALKARLEKRDGEFLVADDGKRFGGVGFAVMSPLMAKTTVIDLLYVAKASQRQGIGKDIFAELETCFPDAEIMRVEIGVDNLIASNFFQAVGFVEVDQLEVLPGTEGVKGVSLEKRIGH